MNIRDESKNLDFIRAAAISVVVIRHLMAVFQYEGTSLIRPQQLGIFGVLVFFVHTSLVLMMSLQRQTEKAPTQPVYWPFIIRRIFRIYPLSVATILLITAAYFTGFKISPSEVAWGTVITNLLLVQNVIGNENLLAPLWTLPVEMQMYLLLPPLFFVARGRGWKYILVAVWPLSVLAGLVLVKFPVSVLDTLRFAPCFVPGVLAFTLWQQKRVFPFWTLPLTLLGLLTLYMLLGSVSQTVGAYPICLILGLTLPFFKENPSRLLHTVCHHVAKYSYGVYLLHDICIYLAFHKMPGLALPLQFTAFLVMLAVSSVLAFHYVEAPMINFGRRFFRDKKKPTALERHQVELIEPPSPLVEAVPSPSRTG